MSILTIRDTTSKLLNCVRFQLTMRLSDELKKEIFNFAFAVYRVTDLFRPDEPLRGKLREHAGEILSHAVRCEPLVGNDRIGECGAISSLLEASRSLIELARQVGLMKAINAEILIRECQALEAYFDEEMATIYRDTVPPKRHKIQNDTPLINDISQIRLKEARVMEKPTQTTTTNVTRDDFNISERQKAILDYLKANRAAKINDLATIFSNRFSLKTLQRDLSRLITECQVERQGDKRWAVYRLNGITND